ncbi:MAG: hypothetical protein U9R17_19840 [Thermodesulfobacteriota bacterium]|nr:hypothetical protein [Thermodesulfobacteriota bacterium]
MENRNLGDLPAPVCAMHMSACIAQTGMNQVYKLDDYKPVEELSGRAWHDFDR